MPITDGLVTLAEVKLSLGIATGTTTYDSDLEEYVEAATPIIENITGPLIAGNRTLIFDGGGHTLVLPYRFNTVTSVTVDGVAVTDFVAEPATGLIHAGTELAPTDFSAGTQNVDVVVTVGSATIPANVKLATRELVRHWWQIGRQANRPGTAEAGVPENGDPWGVPRRVQQLLAANPRTPGFA